MNVDLVNLCEEGSSALTTGTVQGIFLAALVMMVVRLGFRSHAATQHAICFATLLVVSALPVAHFMAKARWPKAEPSADLDLRSPERVVVIADPATDQVWIELTERSDALPSASDRTGAPHTVSEYESAGVLAGRPALANDGRI